MICLKHGFVDAYLDLTLLKSVFHNIDTFVSIFQSDQEFRVFPTVFLKSGLSSKDFVTDMTDEFILDINFLKQQYLMVYTLNMSSKFSFYQENLFAS